MQFKYRFCGSKIVKVFVGQPSIQNVFLVLQHGFQRFQRKLHFSASYMHGGMLSVKTLQICVRPGKSSLPKVACSFGVLYRVIYGICQRRRAFIIIYSVCLTRVELDEAHSNRNIWSPQSEPILSKRKRQQFRTCFYDYSIYKAVTMQVDNLAR